jgi:hypothetical protein
MKQTIGILVACVLLLNTMSAQSYRSDVSKRGTTAAPFLSIGQGARATAMGGAFVAVADDPSAMYWNPGGIAGLEGVQVLVDHTTWIADIGYEYIAATVNLGSFAAIGLNITASNIGDMSVTTIDMQQGTGEVFGVSDVAIGFSLGMNLTDKFCIGFNPKLVYQKIWKMTATAGAIDIGVRYRTPFQGVTLGMSVSNFGTKMQMQGNNALVTYDPDLEGSGNNGRIPANLATEDWELPLNFRVGLAYDVPMGGIGKMTLALDAAHPSDNYESVNVGGEYVFKDFLYLRGGLTSVGLPESEGKYAFGFGVKQYMLGNVQFSLDYAFQDFGRLKNIQKVTLGVGF